MEKQIGINIIIEKEKTDAEIIFIASSPDINVFVEGKNIAEVRDKFIEESLQLWRQSKRILFFLMKERKKNGLSFLKKKYPMSISG